AHRHSKSKPTRGQPLVIVAAIRGATPEGIHVPGAAPQAAPRLSSIAFRPRTAVPRSADVALVPDVRAPLPDVAEHVVQAPGVRQLGADRMGTVAAVQIEPCVVTQGHPRVRWDLAIIPERTPRAEGELARSAGPAGILPLGLGWQADTMAGLRTQTLTELRSL